MVLAGACVLAALNLLSPVVHDIAVYDCELFRLTAVQALDAGEWDDLATACLTPASMLDADSCPRSPIERVGGASVYPLYSEKDATEYFDALTRHGPSDCSWVFGSTTTCSCQDVTALRTIGSERRSAILATHAERVAAATAIRNQRTLALTVITKAVQTLCANESALCVATRALYQQETIVPPPVHGPGVTIPTHTDL